MCIQVNLPVQWKDWEIVDEIGSGAFGSVYKAKRLIGQTVSYSAVKIVPIPADFSEAEYVARELPDIEALQAFYDKIVKDYAREIRAMISLEGLTNIVSIEDYMIEPKPDGIGATIYIRMEYLQSFPDYAAARKITEADVVRLGADMCTALTYCGEIGLIHRDIKPDNIFVSKHGDFKLGDFGIAGMNDNRSATVSVKGTFAYMAPEIFHDQIYSIQSDIYSLGMVLYRLVNHNRDAFINPMKRFIYSEDREDAFRRRLSGEALPKPADCSEELYRVLQKACAYHPKDRYADAKEMKAALLGIPVRQTGSSGRFLMEDMEADNPSGRKSGFGNSGMPSAAGRKGEKEGKIQKTDHRGKSGKKTALIITMLLLALLGAGAALVWFLFPEYRIHAGKERTEEAQSQGIDNKQASWLIEAMEGESTARIDGYRRVQWEMKPEEARNLLEKDGAECSLDSSSGRPVLKAVTKKKQEGILLEESFYFSEDERLEEVDATVRMPDRSLESEQGRMQGDLFAGTVDLLKLFYGEPARKEIPSGLQAAGWADEDGDIIVVYREEDNASEVRIFAYHSR